MLGNSGMRAMSLKFFRRLLTQLLQPSKWPTNSLLWRLVNYGSWSIRHCQV